MKRPQRSLWELVLPAAIVLMMGMMIFPLPAVILDILLVCNISFSILLLLSSVYLAQPERFTSLPTILLLTTLFRLGLNIATTRQLLSGGAVPDTIVCFGDFAVSGNFAVGVIIFLIITVVQFVVISKGAERVAEVAARFALDAMPGKQMAIDADLRAGAVNLAEAKERRLDLQTEAKLYGALDGAMKFVKGDAIAGLFITAINIVGGLLVGVLQQGLSAGDAAAKYTIFTIGDSLASQIPALLVSVGAGIAVTRVADKDGQLLARDLLRQLGRQPQAIAVSAIVLAGFGLMPGLPLGPFLLIACSLAYAAWSSSVRARRAVEETSAFPPFSAQMFSGVALSMSLRAAHLLQQEKILPENVQRLRRQIFDRWGVIVPDMQFTITKEYEGVKTCFLLNGILMSEVVRGQGGGSFTALITHALEQFFSRHLAELLNDTHTRMLLELHQTAAEDLINSVIPDLITVTALTSLLRRLIAEKVSIRSLTTILQAVAEYRLCTGEIRPGTDARADLRRPDNASDQPGDAARVLAAVRTALRRQISRDVADEQGVVGVWMIDFETCGLLEQTAAAQVPLVPQAAQRIIEAADCAAGMQESAPLVLLASRYSREMLAALLAEAGAHCTVICAEELSGEVTVSVRGELGVEGIRAAAPAGEQGSEKNAGQVEYIMNRERKAAA